MAGVDTSRGLLCAVMAFGGLCLTSAALSQEAAGAPVFRSTTTLVLVPTLVRAPANASTPLLRANDFRLTDAGVPQKVALEDMERQPLSVLVVMQTGGAAARQFPAYQKLGTMIANLTANKQSEVSLLTFDSQPEDLFDFGRGVSGLEDDLAKPEPGDRGAAVLDAVNAGIDALRERPAAQRRVIVLLSQQHDEGSHTPVEDVLRRLGENNITIECLYFSPEKGWLEDQFTKPRHENAPYHFSPDLPPLLHTFNLDQPLREALHAMRENTAASMAKLSGGESFAFDTKAELEHELAELPNDFAATYTVSFYPSSKQAGFHPLRVSVPTHPEFDVAARSGYWAAPQAPQ